MNKESTPPSTPGSRLYLTPEEEREGWRIEIINGARMKVLETERLRRALTFQSSPGTKDKGGLGLIAFFQRWTARFKKAT